jgi:hypothetical protein
MRYFNFFDAVYSLTLRTPFFFRIFKLDSIIRYIIVLCANIYVRIFFTIDKKVIKIVSPNPKIIVNLTTFPARISTVWLVVEAILRQTIAVNKVILWLSKEQFSEFNSLPKNLLRLQSDIFEIRLCEGDLKSHKKYYYSFNEFNDCLNITVDDDILYPSTLIQELFELHKLYPTCICCHRAKNVNMFKTNLEYLKWEESIEFCGPTKDLFFTSGGGTLFPPNSLYNDVFDKSLFMNLCETADDIWLNSMASLKNTHIVKSNYFSLCLPILIMNNVSLSTKNLGQSQNDVQLRKVKKYYGIS